MNITEQIEKSKKPFKLTIERLRGANYCGIAEAVEKFFPMTLPYLIEGNEKNPVHHITHVMNFMTEILLKEEGKEAAPHRVRRGVFAALLHDIGFAKTDEGKIRKADIEKEIHAAKDWATVKAAIQKAVDSRKAHMIAGSAIAEQLLRAYNAWVDKPFFTDADIRAIRCVIEIHDDPSIREYENLGLEWLKTHASDANLVGRMNPSKWLFDKDDFLIKYHREADRLWMLALDGIEVDLARDLEKARKDAKDREIPIDSVKVYPFARISGNIKRHREEMWLYKNALGSEAAAYGFKKGMLYRTDTGYQISQKLLTKLQDEYGIVVAVSLGGTKLSVALVDFTGVIEGTTREFPWRKEFGVTDNPKGGANEKGLIKGTTQKVVEAFKQAEDLKKRVAKIGVATKGPIEKAEDKNGEYVIVGPCTTLPFDKCNLDRALRQELEKLNIELSNVEIEVLHDGAAAALGESNHFRFKQNDDQSMAAVIIGTGVGVGIWEQGKLFEGIRSKDPGDDDIRNLGSLGRHLVCVKCVDRQEAWPTSCQYEYRGAPFGEKYALIDEDEGETYFSERVAGPWLARKIAGLLNELYQVNSQIAADTLNKMQLEVSEVQSFLQSQPKELEIKILEGLTKAAKADNKWSREQIAAIGSEIGAALAEFIYVFHEKGMQFVEKVALVSKVAEKLGEGIAATPNNDFKINDNDLLIERLRAKAQAVLEDKGLSQERAEQLANGIFRSNLHEREFWAFVP